MKMKINFYTIQYVIKYRDCKKKFYCIDILTVYLTSTYSTKYKGASLLRINTMYCNGENLSSSPSVVTRTFQSPVFNEKDN